MYRLVLAATAEKDLDKISQQYKPHIFAALFDLRKNPHEGKKLAGKFQDYYSLRVSQYRIIYKIYKTELTVFVIRIGHRQGIYG